MFRIRSNFTGRLLGQNARCLYLRRWLWLDGRPHFHDLVVPGYAVSLCAGDGEGLGYNDSGGIPQMPLISMLLNG